jgi:hypothetical protein
MRRSAVTISLGALLLIAAVAGFVIVPEHKPVPATCGQGSAVGCPIGGSYLPSGLSQTVYDVLRVATWAVLIVGVLLVIVGLINYACRPPESETTQGLRQGEP